MNDFRDLYNFYREVYRQIDGASNPTLLAVGMIIINGYDRSQVVMHLEISGPSYPMYQVGPDDYRAITFDDFDLNCIMEMYGIHFLQKGGVTTIIRPNGDPGAIVTEPEHVHYEIIREAIRQSCINHTGCGGGDVFSAMDRINRTIL